MDTREPPHPSASEKPNVYNRKVTSPLPATAASTSVRKQSLGDEIVDILQDEIIGGRFRPGQRLVERELIARFGVSSIPIREALLELETRGLVVGRHNCGRSVIKLTTAEASRICELRRVLEPKMMEWAAERMTPAAAARLRAQFEQLLQAGRDRNLAAFFQRDVRFHQIIWETADNPYAARCLNTMLGSLFASGLVGSQKSAGIDLQEEARKHRRLLEALCDGDPQRSALALLEIAAGFERHVR